MAVEARALQVAITLFCLSSLCTLDALAPAEMTVVASDPRRIVSIWARGFSGIPVRL